MNRADIQELYFIAPIANVPSIMQHGVLSHRLAERIVHDSVAMPEIQERRKNKQIPGAGFLHDYANTYIDVHNPMLCKKQSQNDEICVLGIDSVALDLPGVIVADRNAASDWVRFGPVDDGLAMIDKDMVRARYWTHPEDPWSEMSHKSIKCAEVLVPNRIEPRLVRRAYVANAKALARFEGLGVGLPASIQTGMFF